MTPQEDKSNEGSTNFSLSKAKLNRQTEVCRTWPKGLALDRHVPLM